MKLCCIPQCVNETGKRRGSVCDMHYFRHYRTGSYTKRSKKPFLVHSHGYILVLAREHPLVLRRAGSNGYEYAHRIIYYDIHGDGPFDCHWCGTPVTWDDMDVDHGNAEKDDNTPENLFASCHPCNVKRGSAKMRGTKRAKYATVFTLGREAKTAIEWAADLGMTRAALKARLRSGWSLERALTTRRGSTGPKTNEVTK